MSENIVHAGIYPHPPVIVPEVGGREGQKAAATTAALDKLAARVRDADPAVLVLISPHGPQQGHTVTLLGGESLTGSLSRFGAPSVSLSYRNDSELVAAISEEAKVAGLPFVVTDGRSKPVSAADLLDHGALVPLYFLERAGVRALLVHLTFAFLSPAQLFACGQAIKRAIARLDRRTALVISGDLSHRLFPGAPAGYSPRGREFDKRVIDLLQAYDVSAILKLDGDLLEEAGECGYRSLLMGLGILEGEDVRPEILSYEGPFGVGYLVADLTPGRKAGKSSVVDESEHVRLARLALEAYVRSGETLPVPAASPLSGKAAGVFVSLKIAGKLRGCIGTIEPAQESLAAEIIANAISAGSLDRRFQPVTVAELPRLEYAVDILSETEEVAGPEELDVKKYGVVVQKGFRRGLLLPDLEGIDTVEEQLAIALQKAGILPGEKYQIFRFTVQRYH